MPLVTAWIGFVMFDVLALAAPGLEPAQRGRMIAWSRPFVVVAIVVITVTGVWQTIDNPIRPGTSWPALLQLREQSVYGLALFWKHGCVLATFALTVAVRFVLAPRLLAAVKSAASGAVRPTAGLEHSLRWLSGLNAAACLGSLILATRMIWALH